MRPELIEIVLHVALVSGYTVLAGILAIAGLLIEYYGWLLATGGEALLAIWVALFGLIAMYFSYLTVREKVLPAVSRG